MYLVIPPITNELAPVLACVADVLTVGAVAEKVQPSADKLAIGLILSNF